MRPALNCCHWWWWRYCRCCCFCCNCVSTQSVWCFDFEADQTSSNIDSEKHLMNGGLCKREVCSIEARGTDPGRWKLCPQRTFRLNEQIIVELETSFSKSFCAISTGSIHTRSLSLNGGRLDTENCRHVPAHLSPIAPMSCWLSRYGAAHCIALWIMSGCQMNQISTSIFLFMLLHNMFPRKSGPMK